MKWFDRFIQRCYNRARMRDEITPCEPVRGQGSLRSSNKRVASTHDDTTVIHFTIYGATGGKIIEAMRYDDKNDRERVHRYVVNDDDDLSNSLSKIVMMENLR